MDARLQRRVQRYGWDKASEHYDAFWRSQLAPAQQRLLDVAALEPGERVVDIACGTGLVTFPAALRVGHAGHVTGTDISERMVDGVREVGAARGVSHVSFDRMDAEELTLPDASFDAALCALGLMYFPDPVQSLREMHRVLRPGGRAVVAVWGARHNCGWADIFPIVDARVRTAVCPLFFHLGTGDALRISMEAAGFHGITTERINAELRYDDADDALGAAFAGGPVALAYSRFDDQTRDEAHAAYLQSIESFRNGAGYDIPGEFVIARGEK